jgi:hypothetical protein
MEMGSPLAMEHIVATRAALKRGLANAGDSVDDDPEIREEMHQRLGSLD